MDKFSVERLVYDGSDPSDDWVVKGIGHSKLKTKNITTVPISSEFEYEAGCKLHDNCLGHMGKSPSGLLLPIQSLSIHNTNISNSVYNAVSTALKGDTEYYKSKFNEILRETMKKKTGKMRKGIVDCHIDGSLRMVITPQNDFSVNTIAVPAYLQGIWKACRLDPSTNRYVTKPVEDGDWAIVTRPPALRDRNDQCMQIRFWPHTCLGISPIILKAFDGDYDGDEMHVNPVYSKAALQECEMWTSTPNRTMEKAVEIYKQSNIPHKMERTGDYMLHTTLSFKQIMEGMESPLMAEQTRTKKAHLESIRKRMIDPETVHKNYQKDSIEGMADINRRYLTQPIIGDMSRIARICASCVSQRDDGWIGIYTSKKFEPIRKEELDKSAGNATIRAISAICASAQQVALDSHRIQKDSLPSHDMIEDLIVGSKFTLVVTSRALDIRQYMDSPNIKWRYFDNGLQYIICDPKSTTIGSANDIVAAYSPMILSKVPPSSRFDVCYKGLKILLNYYSIELSHIEISSLAVLYTYLPGADTSPITTRDGMHTRRLQWTESTLARHYAGLMESVNTKDIPSAPIKTVSACLMAANLTESL